MKVSYAPMEARVVAELPEGDEWQYEPKWDGFRCLAFRDGAKVELRSKSGQSLTRYFPDVVATLLALPADTFVIDGEIVVPEGAGLSFDALLQRIHPAKSRVDRLAAETPATLIVFDLLVDAHAESLAESALAERRPRLEAFASKNFPSKGAIAKRIRLSPATTRLASARDWLAGKSGTDGVMAKRLDLAYASGERTAMVKIKRKRTADCVVGGFRYASKGKLVGSLLLGLYDRDGLLHHVGFTSSFTADERRKVTPIVEKLRGGEGFSGRAPGGPSRWSTERSSEWEPLEPKLVVEVVYDHFTNGRFRHGTKLLHWRPDKAPRQCVMSQVTGGATTTLAKKSPSPAKKAPATSVSRASRAKASATKTPPAKKPARKPRAAKRSLSRPTPPRKRSGSR